MIKSVLQRALIIAVAALSIAATGYGPTRATLNPAERCYIGSTTYGSLSCPYCFTWSSDYAYCSVWGTMNYYGLPTTTSDGDHANQHCVDGNTYWVCLEGTSPTPCHWTITTPTCNADGSYRMVQTQGTGPLTVITLTL